MYCTHVSKIYKNTESSDTFVDLFKYPYFKPIPFKGKLGKKHEMC